MRLSEAAKATHGPPSSHPDYWPYRGHRPANQPHRGRRCGGAANEGGLHVKPQAYRSAVVLVKFPLLPLALMWAVQDQFNIAMVTPQAKPLRTSAGDLGKRPQTARLV
jgi:hypothetical protein